VNRRCGDCTLCCRLLPVAELAKPAATRCDHQNRNGCAVYRKTGFPNSCAVWSCRWLVDSDTAGLRRPDRSHYVVDILPDMTRLRDANTGEVTEIVVIQVWCDPAFPEAWRDPALLAYLERCARERGEAALLVRYNSHRALGVFPPALARDGEWHVVESGIITESRTGSMLMDKLTAADALIEAAIVGAAPSLSLGLASPHREEESWTRNVR
jgi:hypothetical protein